MSKDICACQSCTFRANSLARNEVFIIAMRQGKHDVTDQKFYKIFRECSVFTEKHQKIAADVAIQAKERVVLRDSELARRAAGGPYARHECYHLQGEPATVDRQPRTEQPETYACEKTLLKTFQINADSTHAHPGWVEMVRFGMWLRWSAQSNPHILQGSRLIMKRSRDEAHQQLEHRRQGISPGNDYALGQAKAEYDEEVKRCQADGDKMERAYDLMLEWHWIMHELHRLLYEDYMQGIANFDFSTFVSRCSMDEKRDLFSAFDIFGDNIDWDASEASVSAERSRQYDASCGMYDRGLVFTMQAASREYREYPPLPDVQPDDLNGSVDPRPLASWEHDASSTFGKAWSWWIAQHHSEPDLIHYRNDGTYEERYREFWKRYRDQTAVEAIEKARKQKYKKKNASVPGLDRDQGNDTDTGLVLESDNASTTDNEAQKLRRTNDNGPAKMTGTSSMSHHKRTHGKRKGGTGKKQGKK